MQTLSCSVSMPADWAISVLCAANDQALTGRDAVDRGAAGQARPEKD
jgi:hypothetical protein